MAFMDAPDFRTEDELIADCFMPDLKPGYNPIRMTADRGDSNDV
ncbi:hypothetical protein [Bradyrhizobium sp. sBnM-33]|nr:hypothetical protein [Bradyrhizobium sp. sBnM-33]WOH51009.1 hypothetical protein RX328_01470 [Bradyrhizobium sp. sBnM-33]